MKEGKVEQSGTGAEDAVQPTAAGTPGADAVPDGAGSSGQPKAVTGVATGVATGADEGGSWEPRIAVFLCNWCSYAGADLAGVSRLQYPHNIRIIRVPCSGRINPLYVVKALQSGADGVLVSGCHPGDCHYISGNLVARRKFALLKSYLDYLGIEPERVHFSWVSASEGGRFASLIEKVVHDVREVGAIRKLVKRA